MNNPRNILSKEDIDMLESKNIDIPNKELNDKEWDKFLVEIAVQLEQEDAERIIDKLDDSFFY